MIGIYGIQSPSGKVYIGQSWDIETRFKYYKSHKVYQQPALSNSINKYGFDSHELKVLHELPSDITQDVLDRYEIFYIDTYKEAGIELLNVKDGGRGGKHHEDCKKKISDKIKGRKYSAEHKKNISLAQTGRKNTPERIENVRLAKIGKKYSDAAKLNMAAGQTGRKHSDESKQNRSLALKGIKRTDEQKKNMSEAKKLWCKNNPVKVKALVDKMNNGKAKHKY